MQRCIRSRTYRLLIASLVTATGAMSAALSPRWLMAQQGEARWWSPGQGTVLPAAPEYDNPLGRFGLVNADGAVETAGHPFFAPIGSNGRACVTCHQPADAMSLSVATIRERWDETDGSDPLFAAVDGKNCPHLPQGEARSHSLLLDRGLFRVFLPWPPRGDNGAVVEPEFDIEVVRDPTGCNTHPEYGLRGESRTISVYRRPRPAMNLRYAVSTGFGVTPFIGKSGTLAAVDPETGKPVNMNIMADAREATLKTQAAAAAAAHLQARQPLDAEQAARIEAFERQLYGAQVESHGAGRLDEPQGPPGLGPRAMAAGRDGVLGNNTSNYVIPMGDAWSAPSTETPPPGSAADQEEAARDEVRDSAARDEFRASAARGHDVFFFRTFWIKDSMHINSVGLGNPIKRTCSTCHGMHMTGMDAANGWMDLGTTNLPHAKEEPVSPWATKKPEMPLFKLTCRSDRPPHPFLGRVVYTQDPGRALISGKCDDIGAIVIQQFRGLAARAPYFSNGSAESLDAVVDFYDRRYGIQYTDRERQDLVNFLSVL